MVVLRSGREVGDRSRNDARSRLIDIDAPPPHLLTGTFPSLQRHGAGVRFGPRADGFGKQVTPSAPGPTAIGLLDLPMGGEVGRSRRKILGQDHEGRLTCPNAGVMRASTPICGPVADPRNIDGVSPDGEWATLQDYLTSDPLSLLMKYEELGPEQSARPIGAAVDHHVAAWTRTSPGRGGTGLAKLVSRGSPRRRCTAMAMPTSRKRRRAGDGQRRTRRSCSGADDY